ncbi:MAG: EAL domain-containing protein [Acidiferrobacterales bacterium]
MTRKIDNKKHLFLDKNKDISHIDHSLASVESHISRRDGKWTGVFKDYTLTSAFQPIFSLAHRRPVGHEALLRAFRPNGDSVSPLDVFVMAGTEAETTLLDRLCRAMHVRTYRTDGPDNSWLFLNVNPTVVMHGKSYGTFFENLLQHHNFPTHRVVVEILEDSIHDESQLSEAVGYYRDLGCLVAIDDFGSGHSNFERIWGLAPDIVKLDRSILIQAASKKKVRRVLPSLVSLLHEAGCLVVMEGIESEDEALISMDADVDFVQGYYFGRPVAALEGGAEKVCTLTRLCEKFKAASTHESNAHQARTSAHIAEFRTCVTALQSGVAFEAACTALIGLAGVVRCYLLDGDAVQMGRNLTSPSGAAKADPRFHPLEDVSGARWFRRPYFRRAIEQPGEVHMSRPYLSLTGTRMCVTLAIALERGGNRVVLCCDLAYE